MSNTNNYTIKIHNMQTDEVIEREMTSEEIADLQARQEKVATAQAEAEAKATAKAALLAQLGITEEQARLLLN